MDYFRKATNISPAVIMDSTTKSALITGNSICRSTSTYANVVEHIKSHLESSGYTDLNIKLNVFNIRAAKSLIDLLKSIKHSKKKGTVVHWLCDNEEMMEMGRDYSELLDMEIDIASN